MHTLLVHVFLMAGRVMRESHILIDSEADLSNVVYTHTILTFMIFENGEIVHALRLLSCVLPFFFFFFDK